MKVSLENVCFGYEDSTVLNNVSMTLEGPGLYCIIGPNGVGKSTLVKCINRILTPTSGRITLDDTDVSEIPLKDVSERISYVPANGRDCFNMPVVDAVLIGRHNKRGLKTSPEDLETVTRTLRMLGLEEFAMRNFNELSAGQHQRVALARGLVQETDIIILDEPTANLDVKHQVYVTQILKAISMKRNKMIIMICHDLNIAAKYADRIVVMAPPGVVRDVGTPEKTINREMIREVYGIDCEVVTHEGSPHVILSSEFSGDI